jgi:tetratricopeptide (TPR) repeat protein
MPASFPNGDLKGFCLPPAPATESGPVKAWSDTVLLSTYLPEPADPFPSFIENRVYQGSSGKVYPLPVIERIASEPVPHAWKATHLENESLRIMILPEIGGRIHIGYDKVNGYDFFYRQNVIKPALVGLAGPWISGGVEFNWPQHHRPATYMPCETAIERHDDGSVTVWCSQHDPLSHMKGMHGVCLHPGRAIVELKVRLYNRTEQVETFLWWANVATRVHEHYQSFFPPDVRFVADHARRAVTSFPRSDRPYYGVDYPARAARGVPPEQLPRQFRPDGSYPPDDLSWYANIPVPTSYMIMATSGDFFGGYDHAAQAGVVHIANHHIAPGKKQWTWGNQEFGYNWDRCLTDSDGEGIYEPYIELMAGVYTDNQPDFSFLAPGETKSFSQFWYPLRRIGVPQVANLQAALSMQVEPDQVRVGICVTDDLIGAQLILRKEEVVIAEWIEDVTIAVPLMVSFPLPAGISGQILSVELRHGGVTILSYAPGKVVPAAPPEPATEPAPPSEIASADELYITGLHLAQYSHATRNPEPYWREALRRDPGDARSNTALGVSHLRRGEFAKAEEHLRAAIARLTLRNPNPYDGEAYYQLGIVLRYQGRYEDAYAAFYKSTWNAAWRGPAYRALAELDTRKQDWPVALDHIARALRADSDNLNARCLRAIILRRLNRFAEAQQQLADAIAIDPLHHFPRHLINGALPPDGQSRLDLAFDYARCGLLAEAEAVCSATVPPSKDDGSATMLSYTRAVLLLWLGDENGAAALAQAAAQPTAYVFPSRLEEMEVLEAAIAANPNDSRAALYLGNLLYDCRRYAEAIACWERAAAAAPELAVAHRNLGIGYFNVNRDSSASLAAFDRAFATDPNNPRLLYERDQLWKRTGVPPDQRLAELLRYPALPPQRDDLSVELATLFNLTGQPQRALDLILSQNFQPWEGGEGLVLAQFVRASILLARKAFADGQPQSACDLLAQTLRPPSSLGESWHLLANQSEQLFWLGVATVADNLDESRSLWRRGASTSSDFQQMAVAEVSANTFWVASCLEALSHHDSDPQSAGQTAAQAAVLFEKVGSFARALNHQRPVIDYFASSLPTMLLFHDDLTRRNHIQSLFLQAQSALGLGNANEAESLARQVLALDPSHAGATDLLQPDLIQPDIFRQLSPVAPQQRSEAK